MLLYTFRSPPYISDGPACGIYFRFDDCEVVALEIGADESLDFLGAVIVFIENHGSNCFGFDLLGLFPPAS